VGQGGEEADVAVGGLNEAPLLEGPLGEKIEGPGLNKRSDRLNEIEGHRTTTLGVGVHYAQSRVEADDMAGQYGLVL